MNSREKTGKCFHVPRFVEETGKEYLTCALPEKGVKEGNRIAFEVVRNNLHILTVVENYCEPPVSEACRCNSLFDSMFAHHIDVPAINQIYTRIMGLWSPFMDGCLCYLGSVARAGFHFVKMQGNKPECIAKTRISTQFDEYFKVCNDYVVNGCVTKGSEMVTITKT